MPVINTATQHENKNKPASVSLKCLCNPQRNTWVNQGRLVSAAPQRTDARKVTHPRPHRAFIEWHFDYCQYLKSLNHTGSSPKWFGYERHRSDKSILNTAQIQQVHETRQDKVCSQSRQWQDGILQWLWAGPVIIIKTKWHELLCQITPSLVLIIVLITRWHMPIPSLPMYQCSDNGFTACEKRIINKCDPRQDDVRN